MAFPQTRFEPCTDGMKVVLVDRLPYSSEWVVTLAAMSPPFAFSDGGCPALMQLHSPSSLFLPAVLIGRQCFVQEEFSMSNGAVQY